MNMQIEVILVLINFIFPVWEQPTKMILSTILTPLWILVWIISGGYEKPAGGYNIRCGESVIKGDKKWTDVLGNLLEDLNNPVEWAKGIGKLAVKAAGKAGIESTPGYVITKP